MFKKNKKGTVNPEMEDVIDLDEVDNLDDIELDIIDLNKEKVEEKDFSWKREIISTALYLLVVVALTFLFVQFVDIKYIQIV